MPRTAEQFDNIRKQKKKLIRETALALFAENGFHATSINKIAEKANISKGLTYNYFKSKKAILDEVIFSGFDELVSSFDLNRDGVLTEDEFIYFIKQSFQNLKKNLEYWKLYYSLVLQPPVAESFKNEYMDKAKPIFSMLFEFAKSKGSNDPEADMLAISSLLEGSFILYLSFPGMFPAKKMKKTVIDAAFRILEIQKT
jgi:AcrR family transcriptional regulator